MSSQLILKTSKLPPAGAELLVLHAAGDAPPPGAAADIWAATGLDWTRVSKAARFSGKAGDVLDLVAPGGVSADRLLILGTGKPPEEGDEPAPTGWADRGGQLMARIAASRATSVAVVIDEAGADARAVADLAAGMKLRHYRFDKYKSSKPGTAGETDKDITVTLCVSDKAALDKALKPRLAVAEGTILARDLVNEPANTLGPVEFAARAEELADMGVHVEILTPGDMEELGMGALLCVAQGSPRPARLAIMHWKGGRKADAPIAFVGKGVCFDSGGISIKPAGSMEDMKGDMGGAAAVTGLMKALAGRRAKVNAVGVIGLVENMPDGLSVRPGDIVKAMSGTTIEIINTDAEGRLVLADALWYTQDRFKPKFMVNLATLTGAILVALGHEYAGMFANDNELAERLADAGLASGEKVWRLPLGPAYDRLIESRFADIKNTGGRLGGSITAGQFLQRFVNDVPWAHLDIAGMAFGGGHTATSNSWAPGFGVALLDRLVRDHYEN